MENFQKKDDAISNNINTSNKRPRSNKCPSPNERPGTP